ncbi:MAG: hypothetical protein JSR00_08240 [Bacteroidetes bacterium]|nr:hypothetical protein [Bacteroidota bacterium]
MSKKAVKIIGITLAAILVIVAGSYLYLRYHILKSKDFAPDNSKAKSILDLTPSLIAKLKQVVKDGSNGLYVLDINNLDVKLSENKVFISGIKISTDSLALKLLDSIKLAPDAIFNISSKSLQVDGIDLNDILNPSSIKLENVFLIDPEIKIYSNPKPYNSKQEADTTSLYDKIYKLVPYFSASRIFIKNAQVTNYNVPKKTSQTYKGIDIYLNDILIDSTTRFDRDRFFYSKNATINLKNFKIPTSDSLYFLNCDSINISTSANSLTATGISFQPRISKETFNKTVNIRKDFFNIKANKIVLYSPDWWLLAQHEKLIAAEAEIFHCELSDYINKEKPAKKFELHNFPHQKLLNLDFEIGVKKIKIHDLDLTYEEYNPLSGKSGILYFTNTTGEILNFTNIQSNIAANSNMVFDVKTKFMKQSQASIKFIFNLAKPKTGDFTTEVYGSNMTANLLNPIAEPLGMFHLKSGNVSELKMFTKGNNSGTHSKFTLKYDDLYIIPLKKDDEKDDELKEKKFTGFIANLLLIKKENNSEEPRSYSYDVERGEYPNFFTLNWKAMLKGIVKTIGAPEKLAK